MPSFMTTAAIAALSIAPAVSAHGFVQTVKAGGKSYPGGDPGWIYSDEKPDSVGWYAKNQDNGFVEPNSYGNADIICHKAATPGNKVVEVAAGSKIDLQWNTWPESHKGPIINYLARCHGDCTKIDEKKKKNLTWFKIEQGALVDAASNEWVTDELIANDFTTSVTIPADLQGNFVLRHEIIALHSAGTENGAQNYPQCINLKVTGSGKAHPCNEGADCAKGTSLYTPTEKGIIFNLYGGLTSYPMPGPALFKNLKKRVAQIFTA